jgi:hypothetical protein
MKKVILSVAMMFAAFLTQAAVGKQMEEVKLKSGIVKMNIVDDHGATSTIKDAECSVTMKGKIDLGPIEAEVSCTTTASTCDAATVSAVNCLSAAMRTVRMVIL